MHTGQGGDGNGRHQQAHPDTGQHADHDAERSEGSLEPNRQHDGHQDGRHCGQSARIRHAARYARLGQREHQPDTDHAEYQPHHQDDDAGHFGRKELRESADHERERHFDQARKQGHAEDQPKPPHRQCGETGRQECCGKDRRDQKARTGPAGTRTLHQCRQAQRQVGHHDHAVDLIVGHHAQAPCFIDDEQGKCQRGQPQHPMLNGTAQCDARCRAIVNAELDRGRFHRSGSTPSIQGKPR